MLDKILHDSLNAAAKREGMDLNDPEVQSKLFARKTQIEHMLVSLITQQTKYCGCGHKEPKEQE